MSQGAPKSYRPPAIPTHTVTGDYPNQAEVNALAELGFRWAENIHGFVLGRNGYSNDEEAYVWRGYNPECDGSFSRGLPEDDGKWIADAYDGEWNRHEAPRFDDPLVAAIWIKTELGI